MQHPLAVHEDRQSHLAIRTVRCGAMLDNPTISDPAAEARFFGPPNLEENLWDPRVVDGRQPLSDVALRREVLYHLRRIGVAGPHRAHSQGVGLTVRHTWTVRDTWTVTPAAR